MNPPGKCYFNCAIVLFMALMIFAPLSEMLMKGHKIVEAYVSTAVLGLSIFSFCGWTASYLLKSAFQSIIDSHIHFQVSGFCYFYCVQSFVQVAISNLSVSASQFCGRSIPKNMIDLTLRLNGFCYGMLIVLAFGVAVGSSCYNISFVQGGVSILVSIANSFGLKVIEFGGRTANFWIKYMILAVCMMIGCILITLPDQLKATLSTDKEETQGGEEPPIAVDEATVAAEETFPPEPERKLSKRNLLVRTSSAMN